MEDKSSKLYAYLTPDTGNTSNNAISSVDGQGNGELKEDIFTGTVTMEDLPDKKKWMMSLSLVHRNGLYINASKLTNFCKLIEFSILSTPYTNFSFSYFQCSEW